MYPLNYIPPATQQELQAESLPTIPLLPTGNGDTYSGDYRDFTQNRTYHIVVDTDDHDGLVALLVEIKVDRVAGFISLSDQVVV